MNEVSQEKFFQELRNSKKDIMPSIVTGYPYTSEWRDVRSGTLFGKTIGDEHGQARYFLTEATR